MRGRNLDTAVIIAALTIIGSSAAWIISKRRRGAAVRKTIEEAICTWEDEGGAVPVDEDEAVA